VTKQPRWIIWSVATVVLWAAWVTFAYLPLRQRNTREEAERTEWIEKQKSMLARIEAAPEVMARIDRLSMTLDSVSADLPRPARLKEYMDLITGLGRESGIHSIEASPELASMMSMSKATNGPRDILDTLLVELTAVGEFSDIGTWLDKVEAQSAFRSWRLTRWDRGEEPGTVRFSGAAAFLIAVPRGESS
jgi:hypothetical protein